jgi:hypothetical protein
MGELQAPLGEIESVGAGIEGVAPGLTTLARAATGIAGTVADPPATSAALDQLASRWAASATRLDDEIAALGVATGATAVAYREADEASMNAVGAAIGAAGGGAGGGGGGAW